MERRTLEVTEVGIVRQPGNPLGALGLPGLTRGGRAFCDVGLPERAGGGTGKDQRDLGWQAFVPLGEVGRWAGEVRSGSPPRGWPARLRRYLPWREPVQVPTRGHQSAADTSALSEGREGMWVWVSWRGAPVAR